MAKEQDSTIKRATGQERTKDAGVFPKVILIDTVSFCDLRCSMCVHKEMQRKKGRMSWSLFTKIIDEIAVTDKSVRVWMVFFGEALILKNSTPSIFDMIRYAKDKGLKDVVMNSNANLLDEAASRKLIDSGLDAIYIGIDALGADSYSRIRVGGSYATVVHNVKSLIALKNKSPAGKPDVYVQFVEMDENKGQKDAFIDFWSRQGAIVKIRPKVSWAGSIDAPNLVLGNDRRWPCYWAMQTLSITDTGKVVTCAVDLDARYVAGDITANSIKEVWNGPLKFLRQLHLDKKFDQLPANCAVCRDWQSAKADYYSSNP